MKNPFRMNKFELVQGIYDDLDNGGVLNDFGEACFSELERRVLKPKHGTCGPEYEAMCRILGRRRRCRCCR